MLLRRCGFWRTPCAREALMGWHPSLGQTVGAVRRFTRLLGLGTHRIESATRATACPSVYLRAVQRWPTAEVMGAQNQVWPQVEFALGSDRPFADFKPLKVCLFCHSLASLKDQVASRFFLAKEGQSIVLSQSYSSKNLRRCAHGKWLCHGILFVVFRNFVNRRLHTEATEDYCFANCRRRCML